MKLIDKYKMWTDMIRSDQMSHEQVVGFMQRHKRFAAWYKNESSNR